MKKLLFVLAWALGTVACTPAESPESPPVEEPPPEQPPPPPPPPPPPAVVVAPFDPIASPMVIPAPNDLQIDPATGLANLPVDPNATAAQQEFTRDYFNTLNGFPTTFVAGTKLADLDKTTVSVSTVRFIDLLAGTPLATPPVTPAIAYDEDTDRLILAPPATGWPKGGRYAVAIVGGGTGLKGVGGKAVVGSPMWALVAQDAPLVTCEDLQASDCALATDKIPSDKTDPSERLKEQLARALRLEQLRRSYRPLLDAIAAQGVNRGDIVLLWTFRIMNQPEVTFDLATSVIPFPNDLFLARNPDGTAHVNLPIPANASDSQKQLIQGLNTLDGFSTTAPIISENSDVRGILDTGRVDAASVAASTKVLKLTPGGTVPDVKACINCASSKNSDGTTPNNPQQLQLVPQAPLDEKSTYAATVTTELRDEQGRRVAPTVAFALLRLSSPLVVDGKSQLSSVPDVVANQFEPLRATLKATFDALAEQGLPRSKLALAWTFTTQSTVSTLKKVHDLPASTYGPAGLPDSPLYLFDITTQLKARMTDQGLSSDNIGRAFQGALVLPFALTGPGGTLNPAQPRFDRVPFLLTLPTSSVPAQGYPVTLFSHGFRGGQNNVLPMLDALAAAGRATIAVDAVFHGERSNCAGITSAAGLVDPSNGAPIDTPDKACAKGTCDTAAGSPTYGRCISGTRNTCDPSSTAAVPGDVMCAQAGQGRCLSTSTTDPTLGVCEGGTFKVGSSQTPYISGWNFIDTSNLFAMRDNFRQDTLDHAQLARVLTSGTLDALLAAKGAGKLDGTRIDYLGQSLGGFLGSLYSSVSPHVRNVVLNVPGGDLTQLLLTSPAFASTRTGFLASLAAQGIQQGTPAFDQYLGFSRMILDPADPVNYAYHVENGAAVPAGREALIQYIDQDQVAPNPTTEALIAAANRASDNKKKVSTFKFVVDSAQVPLPLRHGFLLNPSIAPEIRNQAQSQVIGFLNSGTLP